MNRHSLLMELQTIEAKLEKIAKTMESEQRLTRLASAPTQVRAAWTEIGAACNSLIGCQRRTPRRKSGTAPSVAYTAHGAPTAQDAK